MKIEFSQSVVRVIEAVAILPVTLISSISSLVVIREIVLVVLAGDVRPKHYLLVVMLAALAAAVVSLWLAVVNTKPYFSENRTRAAFVVFGLVVGCIGSIYALFVIEEAVQSLYGFLWNGLSISVGAALLIGVRHLHRIGGELRMKARPGAR